ncbi:FCD domain-containing protein [Ponticoccus alexandrii]|uniref:FCD domain-containing protein n=1 Tax=Ponticoccus alexandrii TaxID=1943633 RepID=UPI002041741A|nr:FCD domain-containing protein [Ponticoccus alexandrii]
MEWEAANNAFHDALISRCDTPLLMKMYRSQVTLNDRYRLIYLQATPIQREVIDEHTAIANAAIERRADEAVAGAGIVVCGSDWARNL